MSLATYSATGGRHGGKRPRPLQLASETIAMHVIDELGPRWGLSRATADAALGELREDGLVDWPTPAPVIEMTDAGTTCVVGREVRLVYLTAGAIALAREALGMLNPEISGVTDSSDAAPPVSKGAQAAARRRTTVPTGPPGDVAVLLAFASRNVVPF